MPIERKSLTAIRAVRSKISLSNAPFGDWYFVFVMESGFAGDEANAVSARMPE